MHDDADAGDEVDALVPSWERDGLPPSLIGMLELGKRAGRISWLIQQAQRADLADLGLTHAEFEVLTVLRRAGEPHRLTPGELTRSAFLTSGGTSNVLQRLQKSGYVERTANTGDGRSRFVQLTPAGLDVTDRALRLSGGAHDDVLAGVPPETVREAADALREVLLAIGRRRYR